MFDAALLLRFDALAAVLVEGALQATTEIAKTVTANAVNINFEVFIVYSSFGCSNFAGAICE